MADRLDILIFGATGFTGIHCIPYIFKHSKANGRNLSWGVAGRSEEKLKDALKKVGETLETNFDSVPIVIADINDHESLVNMAKRAKLVINCCGPYRFLGESVVAACIEAATHHIDVSGEPDYMEKVQIEKHEAAQEKGVYVISACAVNSIPLDLGIIHLQENFEGTLNSVETFFKIWSEGSAQGNMANYGTWESIVHVAGNPSQQREIQKRFVEKYKEPPTFLPKLENKNMPYRPKFVDGWAVPFVGSDPLVARRTQGYLYENENIRPVQVGSYLLLPSFSVVSNVLFCGAMLGSFARCGFGRNLLLKYPESFSSGFFSTKPPSEEIIQNTWFSIDFYGQGWKQKLANKDAQYTTPVDRYIKARVKGQNPAYGSTCLTLVLAGITILTETLKLANKGKGGVYPPGAAFAKTSLLKQLNDNGVTFEIIAQGDIQEDN